MTMASSDSDHPTARKRLRIAIEGCGHGTLDAIYASVFKGCEAKGWSGVDLVIICGDFQAVRDRRDLNVTAMPAKYREMADFHQYYWGSKKAPFLTLFIGGNHEASNHLWELYYGGWAAPNIYYLGAANVIRFGPLKIASMSGIWKGYDYKKPHYERLPYSRDDMYSIYHVRELDVRKLLAYRSQVDIGLSHDWPRGIEWLGDHQQLFRYKSFLKEDADAGKLGNVAAMSVLDHLRPPYWFSAHLHVRYAAIKKHGDQSNDEKSNDTIVPQQISSNLQAPNKGKLAAWSNFEQTAKEDDAKEAAQLLQEQTLRREEAERTGVPLTANFNYNETYKRVKLADGFSRNITSVTVSQDNAVADLEGEQDEPGQPPQLPQLDGCCVSRPLKRPRSSNGNLASNTDSQGPTQPPPHLDNDTIAPANAAAANPDAIDLELSDDDEDCDTGGINVVSKNITEESPLLPNKQIKSDFKFGSSIEGLHTDDWGKLSSARFDPSGTSTDQNHISGQSLNESRVESTANAAQGALQLNGNADSAKSETLIDATETSSVNGRTEQTSAGDEVSEDMRAKLAALSTTFADTNKNKTSPSLPHPEDIRNTTTKFLALSKCAPEQRFLQLMEVEPYEEASQTDHLSPVLRYDPEWLAILRVFSPELTLGGRAEDRVSLHRGDTYYRDRVLEEEKWVDEHIVKKDLLTVPDNFVNTLAGVDVSDEASTSELPHESTNPQTRAFCQLIGIDNKFDISETDREARRVKGPNESSSSAQRGRGGFQGQRGGRGGRGGHRGQGGRGRGRRY